MLPISLLALLILFAVVGAIKKITGMPIFAGAMIALSTGAQTTEIEGRIFSRPMLTGVTIYKGSTVVLDSSGYAKVGAIAAGLIADGIADETKTNSGASGSVSIRVKKGIYLKANYASDLVTIAEIGDACYIYDDDTVAKTSNGGTRSIAGRVEDVISEGVMVNIGNLLAMNGDLLAANNLSDVTAATARANIGANKVILHKEVTSLVAAAVFHINSPVAGTLTLINSILENHALATGNATITAAINGTPVTTGVITITQAGSAIGDKDTCSPSNARTVAVGDTITLTVGGTNDNSAATAGIDLLIET